MSETNQEHVEEVVTYKCVVCEEEKSEDEMSNIDPGDGDVICMDCDEDLNEEIEEENGPQE